MCSLGKGRLPDFPFPAHGEVGRGDLFGVKSLTAQHLPDRMGICQFVFLFFLSFYHCAAIGFSFKLGKVRKDASGGPVQAGRLHSRTAGLPIIWSCVCLPRPECLNSISLGAVC